MKNTYKEKYEEIQMKDVDFESVRDALRMTESGRGRKYTFIKYAASAAAVIAILFCIPQVRTFAKEMINKFVVFTFFDGTNAEIAAEEDHSAVIIEESPDGGEFFKIEDGRLYFTYDGTRSEITDQVSDTKYFRFEIRRENEKSVLFIGGAPGRYGWCELLFDADGNYITNRMDVPDGPDGGAPEWLLDAMRSEGVPTGEP